MDWSLGHKPANAAKTSWYARMYWASARDYSFKSTKVEYEQGKASERLASRAARKLFKEFKRKSDAGLNPKIENKISDVAKEYFKHISNLAKKNDSRIKRGLNPLYEVDGGKGYFSSEKCEQAAASKALAKNKMKLYVILNI